MTAFRSESSRRSDFGNPIFPRKVGRFRGANPSSYVAKELRVCF